MLTAIAIAIALPTMAAAQATWPQFRGPGGLGLAPDKVDVPIPFDLKKHVQWKVETPTGHSSPIVAGDRIFLSAYEKDDLLMLAYSRRTGKELWRQSVKVQGEEKAQHTSVCPAMPTACTDGKRVYFYFGGYGLIACDVEGKIAWKKKFRVPSHQFGTANSLVLVDGAIILNRDGARERAVLAIECKDGSVRWKIRRLPYILSYSTPFVWKNAKRTELVMSGTGKVDSYDPKTGKLLWQVKNVAIFVCPTPIGDRDRLYFAAWTTGNSHGLPMLESMFGKVNFTKEETKNPRALLKKFDKNKNGRIEHDELHACRAKDCFEYADRNDSGAWELREIAGFVRDMGAPGRNICIAIKAGGEGDVTNTHVEWEYKRGLPYVASPLLHNGRLYLVKSGGLVTCLDPKTGKAHFRQKRLDDHSEYYASPIGVGDHVFVLSYEGTFYTLAASDKFQIVKAVDFGERLHATPAVLEDQIIVRSDRHLWAIGKPRQN